ncbi:hypothetical protein [Dokdonella koreensis]|uniref:Toxin CptA n=1 Tax=Dokdonella koreensis DS-123 TaxID=1300342 RepID=A0A160DXU0_9GAMM|nr:hypothetical protein [Dokdonella koreensis]ANB19141.1 Hypothetical protein I596_3151 [Dokdonella koreensis DS-123]
MRSAPAIAFDYRPSRLLIAALTVMGSLALVAVALCGLGLPLKLAVAAIVVVCVIRALTGLIRPAYTRIAHGEAGWVLVRRSGAEAAAALSKHVKLGALQVLDLRVDSRSFRVVVLPDNLEPDLRRRLALIPMAGTPSSR